MDIVERGFMPLKVECEGYPPAYVISVQRYADAHFKKDGNPFFDICFTHDLFGEFYLGLVWRCKERDQLPFVRMDRCPHLEEGESVDIPFMMPEIGGGSHPYGCRITRVSAEEYADAVLSAKDKGEYSYGISALFYGLGRFDNIPALPFSKWKALSELESDKRYFAFACLRKKKGFEGHEEDGMKTLLGECVMDDYDRFAKEGLIPPVPEGVLPEQYALDYFCEHDFRIPSFRYIMELNYIPEACRESALPFVEKLAVLAPFFPAELCRRYFTLLCYRESGKWLEFCKGRSDPDWGIDEPNVVFDDEMREMMLAKAKEGAFFPCFLIAYSGASYFLAPSKPLFSLEEKREAFARLRELVNKQDASWIETLSLARCYWGSKAVEKDFGKAKRLYAKANAECPFDLVSVIGEFEED